MAERQASGSRIAAKPARAGLVRGAARNVKAALRQAAHRLTPGRVPPLVSYIAADLVNNCNLRCPFCLVDYSQTKRTDLMSEETFKALISLAPAVADGGFWLSCLHEPTLHPRLEAFVAMIPETERRKFWFTTNLARPLPDSLIATLAGSGLHHINVSLDTFDPALFAVLRKHGRLKVFRDNLDRLLDARTRAARPLPIRFITMAFKSNLEEIPSLVRWMNETAHALEIEVRYTFNTSNIPEDFRREQFLEPGDWAPLRERLDALGYANCVLSDPPERYDDGREDMPANWFDLWNGEFEAARALTWPLELRARPDGRLHLSGRENQILMDLREETDPLGRLRALATGAATPAAPTPSPARSG